MDVDTRSFNLLSLCTGIGGLDLGVELAVPSARTVCGVEREGYCVEVLARRMEEEALAPFPVWSDLRTFDGTVWRGVVDCVTAGYPCQPFSVAGKRRGADDPRHLWPHVARIIRECGAPLCFLENVGGHLRLGAREVIGELHQMGYRTAAGLFTASEVGASHRRERLFILAHLQVERCGPRRAEPAGLRGEARFANCGGTVVHAQRPDAGTRDGGEQGDAPGQWRGGLADAGDDMADPGRERPQGQRAGRATRRGDGALADAAWDDGDRPHREAGERWGVCEAGDDVGLFPPGPGDLDAWRAILQHRPDLAPATQSGVRGVADGPSNRMDRLRCLGNGVVPLQAAHAFRTLAASLFSGGGAAWPVTGSR